MLKPIMGTVVLALVGLFGFYFLTDSSGKTAGERAQDAGRHVFDTAKDTAAGGAIKTKLVAALGLDATRLLHVWYDNGQVIVYGLVPHGLEADRVKALVQDVPGLKSVDVLIQERPGFVGSGAAAAGETKP